MISIDGISSINDKKGVNHHLVRIGCINSPPTSSLNHLPLSSFSPQRRQRIIRHFQFPTSSKVRPLQSKQTHSIIHHPPTFPFLFIAYCISLSPAQHSLNQLPQCRPVLSQYLLSIPQTPRRPLQPPTRHPRHATLPHQYHSWNSRSTHRIIALIRLERGIAVI